MDDRSAAFKRAGSGWRHSASGYASHSFWVPTRAGTRIRYGTWRPLLAKGGWYKLQVRIPGRVASSRKAAYRIRTASGWVKRVRNQRKNRGRWVTLGTFRFTNRPLVRLADKTGERTSLGRRLAFDAIRFKPASKPAVEPTAPSSTATGPAESNATKPADAGRAKPAASPKPEPTPPPVTAKPEPAPGEASDAPVDEAPKPVPGPSPELSAVDGPEGEPSSD